MADKKQYYGLDEIGFVGTQDKRTPAQVKSDIDSTVQYIKAKKSGNSIPARKITTRRLAKSK
ncbi:MAG: hypothetical protein WKF97_06135 [Chitinophagaceae bacterium]